MSPVVARFLPNAASLNGVHLGTSGASPVLGELRHVSEGSIDTVNSRRVRVSQDLREKNYTGFCV